MKDTNYIKLLLQKWTKQSSDIDRQTLDTWLEESDANKNLAKDTEKAWDWSADYKKDYEPDVEAGLSKLKARMAADKQETATVRTMSPRRNILRIAAAIALLIGTSFLLRNFLVDSTNWLELSTAMGETQEVQLPDGTIVTLNQGSTLTYPEAITGNVRKVKLQGEAFFDVAKNPNQPFIIETSKTEVTVLGTSFNVRAYLSEAITEVQVKTGKVRFSPKGSEKALVLEAKDKATFDSQLQELRPGKDATLNAIAWYSKQLSFRKTPLSKVITDLERYFEIEIKLTNPSMANCQYTSMFNNADIDAILQPMAAALDLDVKKTSNASYELSGGVCD